MFGGIFGKGKGSGREEKGASLSDATSTLILNTVGAKSIPPMPAAAQKAFQLSTDPNAEARDFIEVIESDEALSARVIKIANSVYFERGKQSNTIEEAVIVIGMNELRSLLSATTLSEIFPSKHPSRSFLWAHDIATAIIARELARRLAPSSEDLAFLGGLMHDVGKLLLLQRVSEDYVKVLRRVEAEGCWFHQAEEEIFPFTHTEVGCLIAHRWNFSPELTKIIAYHHRPLSESELKASSLSVLAIVKAADIFAHALGLGHPSGYGKLMNMARENLDVAWQIAKIPPAEQRESLKRFQNVFEAEQGCYNVAKERD